MRMKLWLNGVFRFANRVLQPAEHRSAPDSTSTRSNPQKSAISWYARRTRALAAGSAWIAAPSAVDRGTLWALKRDRSGLGNIHWM
eukprot:COSAG02_NODE_2668_length_8293_cov_23.094825_2_plen_86_part_00